MNQKEQKLQTTIAKWLKSKGCYVAKMQAGPGVPSGTPDIFFCKEGFYGFIEVKASKNSKFQPLQKEYIKKFKGWSYASVVYPENWEDERAVLDTYF